jgi:hypothetical protein
MAFQILSAVGTAVALVISGLSLYLQRPMPRLEAQLLWDVEGYAGVAIRNTGKSSAKAPWFLLATGEFSTNTHVANGFLGVEEAVLAQTGIPTASLKKGASRGVVGCVDHKGRNVTWDFDGGRAKRRKETTFEQAFRSFHKDFDFGVQTGLRQQRKL